MTDTATAIVRRDPETIPERVGGMLVPRTVEALEKLLEATKNNAFPLPFRADILPPAAQVLLYSIGGIPADIPPNNVMLFAGRPYIDADGCIDTAIDRGCDVYTDRRIEILGCLDPQSGCPGEKKVKQKNGPDKIIKATPQDVSFVATAWCKKPSGGRLSDYGQCCLHTWAGAAHHRQSMARTRAMRKVAKRALRIPSDAVYTEDEPPALPEIEAEIVEHPEAGAEEATPSTPAAGASDPPQEDAPASGARPEKKASGPKDVVHVGKLAVPVKGEGPWQATKGGDLRTKEQCDKGIAHLAALGMPEGALAAVCKAMFRVALGQVSKVAMDELLAWLETQTEIKGAFEGEPQSQDEEPPF